MQHGYQQRYRIHTETDAMDSSRREETNLHSAEMSLNRFQGGIRLKELMAWTDQFPQSFSFSIRKESVDCSRSIHSCSAAVSIRALELHQPCLTGQSLLHGKHPHSYPCGLVTLESKWTYLIYGLKRRASDWCLRAAAYARGLPSGGKVLRMIQRSIFMNTIVSY